MPNGIEVKTAKSVAAPANFKVFGNLEKYKSHGVELHLANMPFYDASSSAVREFFKQGKNPVDMLAPKVIEYIKENGLYGGVI